MIDIFLFGSKMIFATPFRQQLNASIHLSCTRYWNKYAPTTYYLLRSGILPTTAVFFLQCAGVTMIDREMTQQCYLLFDREIHYSQPGDQIIYLRKEVTVQCRKGWTGDNCDSCAPNFEPHGECNACVKRWAGPACDGCATGWSGTNCDVCDTNFGPPGSCDSCLSGFAGDNCSECDRGWTGPECDACDVNFEPPGNCSRCKTGWTGDNCTECDKGWAGNNCDICEGFGFSIESNCTKCIQNGYWKGSHRSDYLDVHLTFTGDSCSDWVDGKFLSMLHRSHFSNYKWPSRVVISFSKQRELSALTYGAAISWLYNTHNLLGAVSDLYPVLKDFLE